MTTVSVVLPVANQADHIERVMQTHLAATTHVDADVDFVLAVNNSTDGSADACRRIAAAHPNRVTVITTQPGFGRAVTAGLAASRGSVIGFANSARMHTDDLLRALHLALAHPGAIVKGARSGAGYSLLRRAGSALYNAECRVLFGVRAPDINGNPKLWRRELLAPRVLTDEAGFIDAEVLIQAARRNLEVVSFPITHVARHGGRSMTTLARRGAVSPPAGIPPSRRPARLRLGARMRALVTGATGFVGANLVRHLLHHGHDVSVLLRPEADPRRLDGVAREVRVATGDVADASAVSAALRDCAAEWVFHLAAHGAYSWQRDVAAMVRTNVSGAANLIDACGRHRVHALVLAGSSAEYGMCATPPVESDLARPTTDYGVTKAAATALAALTDACPTLTLRLYSVYGPWEDPARLMPTLVSSAMQGRWPVLAARDTMRDLVFVDDVCEAFIVAAGHAAAHQGAVFNVGSGCGTTLGEVTRAVGAVYPVAGAPHFGGHPGRPWDSRMSWVSNPRRIEHELGWRATTTLDDGIRRLGSWILDQAQRTPQLASATRSA